MGGCRWLCQYGTGALLPYGFGSCFVDKLRTPVHILRSNHSCRPRLSLPVLFGLFRRVPGVLLRDDHVPDA